MPTVPGSLSHFVPLNTTAHHTFKTSETYETYLIFEWSRSARRALFVRGDNGHLLEPLVLDIGQLNGFNDALNIRPMRMSVKLTNVTANQNISGFCRVLSLPEPLQYTIANTPWRISDGWSSIKDIVDAHPKTSTVGGDVLRRGRMWSLPPATQQGYTEFHTFEPSPNLNWYSTNHGTAMAMNWMVVEFPIAPSEATQQSIRIDLYAQDAFHVKANTVLSGMARAPASLSGTNIMTHAVKRQANASDGQDVRDHPDPRQGGVV